MSSKKYTVTVYAAAPGTPLFNHQTGLPDIDKETNKQKTSLPGYMFYAISTDGGRTQTAYGFAPKEDAERTAWHSLDMPGKMQEEEHKKYRNPYYARTMEITEQQYTALQNFGRSPENFGFNRHTYNLATNSCIDFTFKALKESGIYKGRPIDYHKEGVKIGTVTVYEKAALRVLENIPVLEKMPDQMNSPLNRTLRGKMPDRTLLQRLLSENEQEQPHRYAASLSGSEKPFANEPDGNFDRDFKRVSAMLDRLLNDEDGSYHREIAENHPAAKAIDALGKALFAEEQRIAQEREIQLAREREAQEQVRSFHQRSFFS
ncbi:hypothetical protein BWD09_03285 [Neisseria dentiae]|uniref:Uncharacterized protein n=1 Tax=Neisseria dentiae TaxID=194197 RepID=A0A1X3DEH0_9NEIS|nr:hypothetical protein [Neisseria dentiae]OSI18216.1 hypothetical protein BWD09_03285 [Neisseria dentiae]QMT44982.1 hypothetical protein H3L92_11335 [Neisseria dentiae]STZ50727.1 Uncharacterised protein [Neisseria dentiae]